MTVNTTKITGFVVLPNDTIREKSSIIFRMTGFDTDADQDAVVVPYPITAPIAVDGSIDVDLWPNPEGVRTTFYQVTASLYNGVNPVSVDLGRISVPVTGGPFDLNDLLPVAPPAGASVEDYIAFLAAAVASAEDAAILATTKADDAAESADIARDTLPFASRADAIASNIADGQLILSVQTDWGLVDYYLDATGTAITTNSGAKKWSPFATSGEYPVHAWDVSIDGSTDDQPAIQAAVDWCIAKAENFVLRFVSGEWRIEDQIDLSASTVNYELRGTREQTIVVPSAFGPVKAMFKHRSNGQCAQRGFELNNGTSNKNHPIGIEIRESGRFALQDITAGGLGNTPVFCTRPFNADWEGLDLFFSGWQPLHKEISTGPSGIMMRLTAGDDRVQAFLGTSETTATGTFSDDDIGKDITIYHSTARNEAITVRIISRLNSSRVQVDRVMTETVSAARFSFNEITAVASGTSLTFARDIGLEAVDVGRMIYVDKAGSDGKTHVTRIASVTGGDACTLEDAVAVDRTARIFFTPTLYIGGDDIVGTGPNDITIDNCLIEGFNGPGLLVDGGLHIKFGDLKTHGRAWGDFSNFGQSAEAILWNGAHKSRIDTLELEFCGKEYDGGTIRVAGDAPGLSIGYMSHNSPNVNGYLFDFACTDTDRSFLGLPEVNGRVDWSRFLGVLKTASSAERRRTDWKRVGGATSAIEASVQGPQIVGSARSVVPVFISDNSSFSFTPATSAGLLLVTASDTPNFAGLFSFWESGTIAMVGDNASGTIGTDTKINLGAIGGVLTLENKSGAGRRFHVSVLG